MAMAAPQFPQNFLPGVTGKPQPGHVSGVGGGGGGGVEGAFTGVPHSAQNFLPGRIGEPHARQD